MPICTFSLAAHDSNRRGVVRHTSHTPRALRITKRLPQLWHIALLLCCQRNLFLNNPNLFHTMGLKLYTAATPNGHKISIFLEALGLKYDIQSIDISTGEQKSDWFLKLNPNGRIPTLVDSDRNITLSELGAILQYLADTYDTEHKFSYKVGTDLYYKQLELLYFQMAGVGPMQGQCNHFKLFSKEKVPYGIQRYTDETKRLYGVLELYLERNKDNGLYLVGDHLSIADFATFPWANLVHRLDIDPAQWPLVNKWIESIRALPATAKGLNNPPSKFK